MLHAPGNFSDEGGPARVVEDNLLSQDALVSSGLHAVFDFLEPGYARAIARQVRPGFNEDESECAVR